VQSVIQEILGATYYQQYFDVPDRKLLAHEIIARLPDGKREIELAHVQVFLTELWERAAKPEGKKPKLQAGLVRAADNLEGVLNSFLRKQLEALSGIYGKDLPLELLAAMISERHTKLQLSAAALEKELLRRTETPVTALPALLQDLIQRRIVRTLRAGDDTEYELSHDVLAQVVGQNLTEDMQLREKARNLYTVYADKSGLFTQEDLDHLRPYEQYLNYPPELAERMRLSAHEIQQKETAAITASQAQTQREKAMREKAEQAQRKARRRARVAAAVAVVAALTATLAFYFYKDADKKKQEAEQNLQQYYAAEIQRHRNEIKACNNRMVNYRLNHANDDDSIMILERLISDSLQNQIDKLITQQTKIK
jgi:uncharacterized membrane protein